MAWLSDKKPSIFNDSSARADKMLWSPFLKGWLSRMSCEKCIETKEQQLQVSGALLTEADMLFF